MDKIEKFDLDVLIGHFKDIRENIEQIKRIIKDKYPGEEAAEVLETKLEGYGLEALKRSLNYGKKVCLTDILNKHYNLNLYAHSNIEFIIEKVLESEKTNIFIETKRENEEYIRYIKVNKELLEVSTQKKSFSYINKYKLPRKEFLDNETSFIISIFLYYKGIKPPEYINDMAIKYIKENNISKALICIYNNKDYKSLKNKRVLIEDINTHIKVIDIIRTYEKIINGIYRFLEDNLSTIKKISTEEIEEKQKTIEYYLYSMREG
ncbi:hypothetical protein [Nanobdella aerobiophila]|nr:hypothetical protein [Nanobdella aerobiophila]